MPVLAISSSTVLFTTQTESGIAKRGDAEQALPGGETMHETGRLLPCVKGGSFFRMNHSRTKQQIPGQATMPGQPPPGDENHKESLQGNGKRFG